VVYRQPSIIAGSLALIWDWTRLCSQIPPPAGAAYWLPWVPVYMTATEGTSNAVNLRLTRTAIMLGKGENAVGAAV